MASGESAFNLCLPVKGYDKFLINTKSLNLSEPDSLVIKAKTDPLLIRKDLDHMKYNLVNSNVRKRQKETTPKISFLYLVNACKIIKKNETSPRLAKKTYESQSLESVDDTNCTAPKRFELAETSNIQISKTPQVVANELSSISDFISASSSWINRPKKFGDRPDVIYKTILRSFKKYYLADFNEVTDYKRKKRRIANQAFLIDMTAEYAQKKFSESPFDDLGLFIAALVQPKLPLALESNLRLQELSRIVCEVLYRFNKSKMNDLLWYPQFSYILKKFLGIPDLLNFIGEKSTSPQATQNLIAQINFLIEKCDDVLTKSSSADFGEIQNPVFEVPKPKIIKEGLSG